VVLRLRVMLDDQHARTHHPRDAPHAPDDDDDDDDEGDFDDDGARGAGTNGHGHGHGHGGRAKGKKQKQQLWRFEGVVSVLMALLEPPALDHVRRALQVRSPPPRSLPHNLCTTSHLTLLSPRPLPHACPPCRRQYLYDMGLLSSPDDGGTLTDAGKLAGQLPVDLHLGRFVSYGALLGLAEEAATVAVRNAPRPAPPRPAPPRPAPPPSKPRSDLSPPTHPPSFW